MSANTKQAQESLEMSETDDVQKSVVPAVAVTDIAEYRPHEEQIVRLETTYAKLVVDCSTSESVKESVILPEEYAEFEAEGTIARDNAIEQLETLHKSAVEREEAAAKLLAQQKELDELREKQRIADAEAEELRKQRAEEDRLRLKKQQEDLDQQRRDMETQQRQQREQQEEQQRQQRERDAQYQRDQEELVRLRAQAAAPAPATSVAAPMVAEKVDVAPISTQAIAAENDDVTTTAPAVDDIVEVVALGFDVDLGTARAWLQAIRF
ncbi:hypothetical protein [Pseudomonas sp. LB3P58]